MSKYTSIINDLDTLCEKCNSDNLSRAFIYMNEFNNILKQFSSDIVGDIKPIKRSNPDVYFSTEDEERLRVISEINYSATKLLQKLRTI